MLWAFVTDNRVLSVAPVGDLDGDGRAEVAVGTQNTNNTVVVHVLSGGAATPIFSDGFESGGAPRRGLSSWAVNRQPEPGLKISGSSLPSGLVLCSLLSS